MVPRCPLIIKRFHCILDIVTAPIILNWFHLHLYSIQEAKDNSSYIDIERALSLSSQKILFSFLARRHYRVSQG